MGLGGGGGGGGGGYVLQVPCQGCRCKRTYVGLYTAAHIFQANESSQYYGCFRKPAAYCIEYTKMYAQMGGGGGHDPLAPRPGYATGSNMRHSVTLTFVMVDSPIRYDTMHTTRINHSLRFRNKCGHSSTQAVMKPSIVQN